MFSNLFTLSNDTGIFAVLALLPIILYLALTGFGIYFIIKVIKFMNAKTKSDHERNEKIAELIKAVSEGKKIE